MHCTGCGKKMAGVQMRCPECRRWQPALWLNVYSVLVWVVIVGVNYVYLRELLPSLRATLSEIEVEWPLGARAGFGLPLVLWGPAILLLGGALLLVLRRKRIGFADFIKSGKALAGVTWLALALTMVWVLSGFAASARWLPQVTTAALELRVKANELSAIESVRRIIAAEARHRASHPEDGFTCSLEELENTGIAGRSGDSKDGYNFWLLDCEGSPAASYQVAATPLIDRTGRRAFCADESGTIYFSEDGESETCLSRRTPLY